MVGHFDHHWTEEDFHERDHWAAEEDHMWWEGGKIKPNESKSKLKAVYFQLLEDIIWYWKRMARQDSGMMEWNGWMRTSKGREI